MPIVLAGESVEAVAAEHLVRIFHGEVLVAEHVQRRKPSLRGRMVAARCVRLCPNRCNREGREKTLVQVCEEEDPR